MLGYDNCRRATGLSKYTLEKCSQRLWNTFKENKFHDIRIGIKRKHEGTQFK